MGHRIDIPPGEYLKGLDTVIGNIQAAVDKLDHGSTVGLADALLFVAGESQQRAPKDTGDLRGSVEVKLDDEVYAHGVSSKTADSVVITGDLPETAYKGEVSYNTKYAAAQHEQTAYSHENGQAKYLESVLVEHQDRILNLIAGGVADELEGT